MTVSVWNGSALLGIYTLTPTHFGTGQTTGAVDLPIARDAATGFPILPATGVKGVARDVLERLEQEGKCNTGVVRDLFGPTLDAGEKPDEIHAGLLAFTEARLLAYPVRALTRPFLHVTCPLILERFARDLRALGLPPLLGADWSVPQAADGRTKTLVSDKTLSQTTLVLEDLIYPAEQVGHLEAVQTLAQKLADLLWADEKDTRSRLERGLVIIPDMDFACLMETAIPVQARIKLTRGKTTDTWTDPDTGAQDNSGNLWYEEQLPADCLFVALIGERRQRTAATGAPATSGGSATLDDLIQHQAALKVVQIGGNETVGQGLCLWHLYK